MRTFALNKFKSDMEILEAIKERRSLRTFSGKLPSDEVMTRIKADISSAGGQGYRIVLIESEISPHIGTYGVIRNAPAWLALITDGSAKSTLCCAMEAEKIVLDMTAAGLGSCWLAGTCKSKDIEKAVKLSKGEKVVAVIPFGIPADHKRFIEVLQGSMVRSRSRKPFEKLFSLSADAPQCYSQILEAVRLAPSAANAQPWRIIVDSSGNATFTSATDNAYTMLDMGIALSHFTLAASALGVKGHLAIPAKPAPENIARFEACEN